MTVTSRKYFTNWFVANGVNKDWSFDFTILAQEDVVVQVRTGTDDTTIVEYTTDLGFFPADDFASGTVRYPVLAAAVPVGQQVRLLRRAAYLQKEQIGKEGRFLPQTHERAFDRVTILTQQVDNQLDRAVKVIEGATPLTLVSGLPDGAVLMVDGPFIVEGPNASSINSAQSYAEDAKDARDLAQAWANNPENSPILPGLYSAYHWSAKASASAYQAGLARDEANLAAVDAVRYNVAQSKTPAEQGQARANIGADVLAGFRNKIINGDGAINQRAPATVADDVYWCDRHYALTQTAAITPSILSDVANGLPSMMRLTQSQASAQRMGNAQILEASASKPLRGRTVTLGGRARSSVAQTIRYAVLEWTGAADVVTSDVVSNWTATAFTPGNFFLAANLVVAAAGSVALSANTLTDWSLVAPISGACNNIIVLYWTAGAVAQNVTVDMAWQLVEGDASAEAYPFEVRHPQQELVLCQRYYLAGAGTVKFQASTSSGDAPRVMVWFKVTMRATPTLALTDIASTGFPAGVPSTELLSPDSFAAFKTANATGNVTFSFTYRADAEL